MLDTAGGYETNQNGVVGFCGSTALHGKRYPTAPREEAPAVSLVGGFSHLAAGEKEAAASV
jgi:hypothetical protein